MDTSLTTDKSADTFISSSSFRQSASSPSRLTQTHCLNTTVPINIAGTDIGGRHTPTKNALRHSRMIALNRAGNKNGTGHLSIVVKYPKMAKYFVCLQNKTAMIILLLSTWMWTQIPNLSDRDIPYWSGTLLLISGLLNAMLLWCCQKKVSDNAPLWYAFYPKITALAITILASLVCLCALIFASIHIYVIETAECERPPDNQNVSCVCRVIQDSMDIIEVNSEKYEYPTLNCLQVSSLLAIALIGSAVANATGTVISLYYVFLHKTSTVLHKYSQVPAGDSSPLCI